MYIYRESIYILTLLKLNTSHSMHVDTEQYFSLNITFVIEIIYRKLLHIYLYIYTWNYMHSDVINLSNISKNNHKIHGELQ